MVGWQNFFFAQVGAAAALAGLIFVAVSINLAKIMSYPGLPGRALESLILLLSLLIISSFMLVPDQPPQMLGVEVLVTAVLVYGGLLNLVRRRWKVVEAQYRRAEITQFFVSQGATLPFVVAGLVILGGNLGGVYWVIPGMVLTYVNVFINAWVLLVEINR